MASDGRLVKYPGWAPPVFGSAWTMRALRWTIEKVEQTSFSPGLHPHVTRIRTGQAPAPLTREQFQERFNVRFYDPVFDAERDAIARLEVIAWEALQDGRKAPLTRHEAKFQEIAWVAKRDCPLSKALAAVAEISLKATLDEAGT